ncbi:LLM class flavin-dependent oxidoreductase [Naumannella halotolerans]|uniref:FMN-dependent oxidoreductase (Nitrilotriacetate monooxygenase family) n=1 Tax=Naumannella halotolerans TaxID=993414 RepID=A0A4R7IYN0_9ACTN|nr:LLM class flavin-dependent oxidoreductase [Naumannella halotolerans]TDT29881.1 FMN-dependent oxidoreductase (nitrilotriacetate monooxygenase family) [Naumannella halotolerans]
MSDIADTGCPGGLTPGARSGLDGVVTKQIALSALIVPPGNTTGAWRHPDVDPAMVTDVEQYKQMAQLAERGFFDLFFLADTPATRTDNLEYWSQSPMYFNSLEPLTVLSAVAGATQHIGLGATASTSFVEPFNIARMFASLDHISHGRAAWNVVTSANDYAARNFGQAKLAPHDERYVMAEEAFDVVSSYWDTWEDDAFVYDKENAVNFDPSKFHVVDHDGKFFRVYGGLPIARPPQGWPVIIQAGASVPGKELAARTAEVVFGTGSSVEAAKAFYDDLKGRMEKYGRHPDELKVLSGLQVIVGRTEAEAIEKRELMDSLVPIGAKIMHLCNDLETSLFDLPLDEPVPLDRIPEKSNHHQVYFAEAADLIRQGLTLREVAMRFTRATTVFCGDPVQVADHLQDWVDQGAGDGFMMSVNWLPGNLADFVELAIPELQRRGMVRTEWTGSTLRENLGLARPANQHVKS